MFRALLLLLLVASHPLCGVAGAVNQKEPEELRTILEHQVQDYRVTARGFVPALMQVADSFKIPMGIEWVRGPGATKGVNRSWKLAKVEEIIRSLVESEPGYKVEVDNNVVHVFPRDFLHDPHNFLNLEIKSLDVDHALTVDASRQLRDVVKRTVSPPSAPNRGGIAGSLASGQGEYYVTLTMTKVPVRAVLDALALRGGFKIWVVTFSGTSSLTPTGFYRTLSLWSPTDVPDEEQPVWDRSMWGQYPPIEK